MFTLWSDLSIHPPTRIGRYHFGWGFAPPTIYVSNHYYINASVSQCFCKSMVSYSQSDVACPRGYRQMTETTRQDTHIYKQRQCSECGCNTLIESVQYDSEALIKYRHTRRFCIDCDDEVETELVDMKSWKNHEYKNTNSALISKLNRRLENARATIKRMNDDIEKRLSATL